MQVDNIINKRHKVYDDQPIDWRNDLDDFTIGYLVCALWCTTPLGYDPEDENCEFPETLDEYSIDNLTQESLRMARKICTEFQELAGDMLLERDGFDPYYGSLLEHAGHDFWLTHNGHGAGFWDGRYPDHVGKLLTEMCNKYIEGHLDLTLETEDQDAVIELFYM